MTFVATPHTDRPGPRVELNASGFVGATHLTVTRTYDGITETVREAKNAPTSWPRLLVDYESPIDTPVTYTIDGLDEAGVVVGSETAAAVTVPRTRQNPSWVWIHDPYVPARMLCLPMESGSLSELGMNRDLSVARVLGTREAVAIGGPLSRASMPWAVFTEGDETAAFEDMVAHAHVLAIRSVAPVPLRRVAYLASDDVTAQPIDAPYDDPRGMYRWVMPQTQVRAPSASYAVPVYTWDDVETNYATWDAVEANKATWLDLERNPEPGV